MIQLQAVTSSGPRCKQEYQLKQENHSSVNVTNALWFLSTPFAVSLARASVFAQKSVAAVALVRDDVSVREVQAFDNAVSDCTSWVRAVHFCNKEFQINICGFIAKVCFE